jgi:carbon-monoxide dehydrogenase large subunit
VAERGARRLIGKSVARPNARALLEGRGRYVDDISAPGMLHVAFARSPYAHARIAGIEATAAREIPGVVAVVSGRDLLPYCRPWTANLTNLPPMKSAPQYAMPPERACWQGEAVVAVVAESRAVAEDAAEHVDIDWEPLAAVAGIDAALSDEALVHPDLGTNVAWRMEIMNDGVEQALAGAEVVVERDFEIARQTGVTLEPRGVIADFNPALRELTLHHSTQVPHIYRSIYARQLALPETAVRILCPDVGGGFGLKLHVYGDELATAALSVMLGRPVKFIADRLESFVADIHCRGHRVKGRLGVRHDGRITAMLIDDVSGAGAYSIHPRTSTIEALLVAVCTPLAYRVPRYGARVAMVLQNEAPTGQFRGVGMPIATLVAEGLIDAAAVAVGLDKAEMRRRNLVPDDAYPCHSASGELLEGMSLQAAQARLLAMMSYERLRAEQRELRAKGIHRGIGIAAVTEGTAPSPLLYAAGGAPISSRDACTLRLESEGGVSCATGLTDQGQGGRTIVAQIVADTVGVGLESVSVLMGDTAATPFGGGTWASRGTAIAGEAALQAARAFRARILELAECLCDCPAQNLDIVDGVIIDRESRSARLTLRELGQITHFRPTELPADIDPELVITRHYSQREQLLVYGNCAMGVSLEVDVKTGAVRLLKIWVVEDCGTVVNPRLVDEQIRGGVVMGLGSALYEECLYDADGQLRNGNLMEYLVPMAAEMPDIEVAHLETPTKVSALGAKGCGEAGTIGIGAAVMNAINDALEPLGASVTSQPFTPEKILRALGVI